MNYSSMDRLWDCPRRFQLQEEEKLQEPGEKIALNYGSLWHKIHEVAFHPVTGATPDDIVDEALKIVEWHDVGSDYRTAAKARLAYKQWLEKYAGTPWNVLESETRYEVQLIEGVEAHTGRFDAVVEADSGDGEGIARWLVDYKTTSKLSKDWIAQYRISNQFRLYFLSRRLLGGEEPLAGVLVDLYNCSPGAVKTGKTPQEIAGNHFYRLFIRYDDENSFVETYRDYEAAVQTRDSFRAAGYFPKNTGSCWRCPFVDICDTIDPELREALKEGYKK